MDLCEGAHDNNEQQIGNKNCETTLCKNARIPALGYGAFSLSFSSSKVSQIFYQILINLSIANAGCHTLQGCNLLLILCELFHPCSLTMRTMQPGWGTALVFPRLMCTLILTGPAGNWGRGARVYHYILRCLICK